MGRKLFVRAILLLVAINVLSAGLLGVRSMQACRQRAAVRRVSEIGGAVVYDYQLDSSGLRIDYAQPPYPKWLVDRVGIDFFARVKKVEFFESGQYQPEDWTVFRQFPDVEEIIFFDAPFFGEGARHLAEVPRLKSLIIQQVGLTVADMSALGTLKRIERLCLCQSQFTDEGVLKLRTLTALKQLDLRNRMTATSSRDVPHRIIELLQSAMPDCEIQLESTHR